MNFTENKRSRWFTVADALIIVVALLLLVGAALLFLMPNLEKNETNKVKVTLQINFEQEYQGKIASLNDNIPVFSGDEEIGTMVRRTPDNLTVYADMSLVYEDGIYYYNGAPLRINGSFVLETKLDKICGRIVDIQKEG
ncbi:MAG: hypothetical protein IJB65_03665 [Clostridia bacterium]|nr:hypothetical protein [Clostridia bacterium]